MPKRTPSLLFCGLFFAQVREAFYKEMSFFFDFLQSCTKSRMSLTIFSGWIRSYLLQIPPLSQPGRLGVVRCSVESDLQLDRPVCRQDRGDRACNRHSLAQTDVSNRADRRASDRCDKQLQLVMAIQGTNPSHPTYTHSLYNI